MTQTLTIHDWIPEQLSNGPQGSWRTTWRKKKDAAEAALLHARSARWTFVPGKVRLEIVFVFPQHRRRDYDGLVARCKGLLDGLKGHFFTDDDTEHLILTVRSEVIPPRLGGKETRISLSPA